MAKLVWGAAGERTFEAGVDRGVLYVPGFSGVAWNGLKSVKEAPSGGDPQPYYLDGTKYANVAAAEEFNATLEAFSSPPEFALCEGNLRLAAGLFATQQPRKPFGFSYRSKIGNDVIGLNSGYKLHLVYNALAAPSGRDNNSTSNTIDPLGLSWNISTRPPIAPGIKPTSHFVVSSIEAGTQKMQALEEILYGTTTSAPSLISVSDLLVLFAAPDLPLNITEDGVGGYTAEGLGVSTDGNVFALDDSAVTSNPDGTFSISY